MSPNKAEAIRQRIAALLTDSRELKRNADRIGTRTNKLRRETVTAVKLIADRIDCETRELFHLLPRDLVPARKPRLRKPRGPRSSTLQPSVAHGHKPGGSIPLEVRWPAWTIEEILALADAYKEKYKKWPHADSGRISESRAETWNGIDLALKRGNRNLPGGSSLALLLLEHRKVRTIACLPDLDLDTIVEWAKSHFKREGSWPTMSSGKVFEAPDETWSAVAHALNRGTRGLPDKPHTTTLARLLAEKCDAPFRDRPGSLSTEQILQWADAHYDRTGKWPTRTSGDIQEAPGETWKRINDALVCGNRSLTEGSSLAKLLAEHRGNLGARNRKALPPFSVPTILKWADAHYKRHGRWPSCWSGQVEDAPGETWKAVNEAFKSGARGLRGSGYSSLAQMLDEKRSDLRRRQSDRDSG